MESRHLGRLEPRAGTAWRVGGQSVRRVAGCAWPFGFAPSLGAWGEADVQGRLPWLGQWQ
jgi:hypothetical protein